MSPLIKLLIVLVVIAAFCFLASAVYHLVAPKAYEVPTSGDQVACTMDAKMCPDGSYVGRTGPKCEFAACPH